MKLLDIVTERTGRNVPFMVDYELNTTNEDGDDVVVNLEVEGTVSTMQDPYATGDSPTMYEVNVRSILASDQKQYRFTNLSRDQQSDIEQAAINSIQA